MIAWNFETGMLALGQEILWDLELFVMMPGQKFEFHYSHNIPLRQKLDPRLGCCHTHLT